MLAARSLFCALVLVPVLQAQTPPPCADRLLTVSPADNLLRTVDPLTGTTLSSVPLVDLAGRTVNRSTGIARNPQTGQIFVMMNLQMVPGRELGILNPATGVVSSVGNTGDNFAGIAFVADGTLYGVTGDGGNNPETLYRINIANAVTTQIMALGNGNDGESLAFNPRDGMLYHASGCGDPLVGCSAGTEIFERIDLSGPSVTNIPLSGFDHTETLGMVAIGDSGNFLMTDLNDELCLISDQGFVTRIATMDAPTKGMVYLPEDSSNPFFRHYGFGCAARNGAIPWFTARGCPQAGQMISLELLNAPRSAFGLVLLGFGQTSVPIPSPSCPLQILPTSPGAFAFTTSGSGTASFPIQLPSPFPPGDFFFQAGVLDGMTAAVVSNPLQIHLR